VLEALQRQHELELEQHRQNADDELSALRRSHAETTKKMEDDFQRRLKAQ
jgi:hypothetical protein